MSVRTGIPLVTEQVAPPKAQQARSVVLFDKSSVDTTSRIFEVRETPLVITAYGLVVGETLAVYSVYGALDSLEEQLFRLDGKDVVLSFEENTAVLRTAGRYRVKFSGILGDLVAIYTPQIATDTSVLPMPSGAQANRPNLFFDGVKFDTSSPIIEIKERPWAFFAYGLQPTESIAVYSVYGYGPTYAETPFTLDGVPLYLSDAINAIRLNLSGRYRFVLNGDPLTTILVGNPVMPESAGGSSGPIPPGAVTSVGLANSYGLTIVNSPITSAGTIVVGLNAAVQASLSLADTALQLADVGVSVQGWSAVLDSWALILPVTKANTAVTFSPGTGLTGGGDLSANRTFSLDAASIASLALANSALQDAPSDGTTYGRNNGTWVPAGGGTGTVTSVAATGSTGLTVGGSPITGAGTLTFTLSANLQAWSGIATTAKADSVRLLTAGTGLTGGGDLTADRSFALNAASIASLALADSAIQPADSVTTLNMATARVLGRSTAGAGAVEEIQIGSGLALAAGTLSATATAPAWGGITGTLSDQADLQTALDGKQSLEILQNIQSADYTLVLADSGKQVFHPSADTTARTFTIPANATVAYPLGTAITFVNQNGAGVLTIAITTDTMRLAGAGTTGSRTLAANGIATALKVTATEWLISGTGLT